MKCRNSKEHLTEGIARKWRALLTCQTKIKKTASFFSTKGSRQSHLRHLKARQVIGQDSKAQASKAN